MRSRLTLGILIGLVAGATGGAGFVAWSHPGVDDSAIVNASSRVLVTARVESMPVRERYLLAATVTEPKTIGLMPTVAASGREVISTAILEKNVYLNAGDVVGEVSGRPVIAIPETVPLHRDLHTGMSGSDVKALQKWLYDTKRLSEIPTDGKLDQATAKALQALLQKSGFKFSQGEPVLPLDCTALVPFGNVRVERAGRVGQMIDADNPLAVLEASSATLKARVNLLQADTFGKGSDVDVSVAGSSPVRSSVIAVSEFLPADKDLAPGYDITVSIPEKLKDKAVTGISVTISDVSTVETAPAIPLTAIRQDGQTTYVIVPDLASAESEISKDAATGRRVDVAVVGQANGYAIIAKQPTLAEGTEVVVSGL